MNYSIIVRNLYFLYFIIISYIYAQIELPLFTENDMIIYHTAFTLSYNEQHEQADWVAYELTEYEVNGIIPRSNNFRIDKNIITDSATLQDYKGSGYDRGHLAPAGDMKWSNISMSESFFMSNISPQKPGFNRGIWKKLEEQIRVWALENKNLYISTGGILKNNLPSIGINNVTIPNYYYKVILDYTEPEVKGIGFILPNKKSNYPIKHFAVSIDEVENITGINFFHSLPDSIEESIESNIDLSLWNFN